MEKAIIGDILKKRIKEKGYTQEAFAEEVGIGFSTLKTYLSGEREYRYEDLKKFAEKLDCSYDYLMGLSKSPIKEYHEIAEQTRLSENAIRKITGYAKDYDTDFDARRFIMCLDMLLCEEGVFRSICDFMIASRFMNTMFKNVVDGMEKALKEKSATKNLEIEKDRIMSLEAQQMVYMVSMLKDMKAKMTPEFIAEIKALDTDEFAQKEIQEMNDTLKTWKA